MQLLIEMLAQAMERAGSTDTVAVARALERRGRHAGGPARPHARRRPPVPAAARGQRDGQAGHAGREVRRRRLGLRLPHRAGPSRPSAPRCRTSARCNGPEGRQARCAKPSTTSASNIREVANAGLGRDDVLAFWFGESDELDAGFIREAAVDSLQQGETFYAHNLGLPELREAVARLHRAGCTPRSCRPHRHHLGRRQRPDAGDAGAGRRRRRGGRGHAGVAQPDGAAGDPRRDGRTVAAGAARRGLAARSRALREAVTPATKLLLVNAPNNPTGWTLTPRRAAGDPRALPRTGTWILADEVYERLYFEPAAAARPASWTSRRRTTAWSSCTASRKSFLMTGWRLGWLVLPPALVEAWAS